MSRIIRTILRRSNTVYDLANATARITVDKPTVAVVDDYVLKISDAGKLVNVSAAANSSYVGANVFIPSSVFNEGQMVRVYNSSASNNLRIKPNASVILLTPSTTFGAGNVISGTDGIRNVSPFGVATILCVATDTFVIHGPGVSSAQG